MHTKITDCSYTSKNGYTWRKRFKNSTLSIALRTHDHNEGLKNATLMTMKFMEYTLTKTATIENLKILMVSYRDSLVTSSKMAALQATLINLNVDVTNPVYAIPAVAQVAAVELKTAQAAVPFHTLKEAKAVYIESNPTWRSKTSTQFTAAANHLLTWAATNHIRFVEDLTRDKVDLFKRYLDGLGMAISSKNTYMTRYRIKPVSVVKSGMGKATDTTVICRIAGRML